MNSVSFSELPGDLRVKLSAEGEKELWHRVDEFGGIKSVSEAFSYSQSGMYNWKNKDLALPVSFVRQIMGQNHSQKVVKLKGPGSSGEIGHPEIPLKISDELLTRVEASVKVNDEGTPFYIVSEISLLERFTELFIGLGDVDYEVYEREYRYEVRYPKFLQDLFTGVSFDRDITALVDEKGVFRDGKIFVDGEVIDSDRVGELYSREKSFEIALIRGDSSKIAELMAEESEKVKGIVQN